MKSEDPKSKSENPPEYPRIDLRDKVTGEAQYVEDLPDLPHTAYGATLLSPYSHARILKIDSSEAKRSLFRPFPVRVASCARGCWANGEINYLRRESPRSRN